MGIWKPASAAGLEVIPLESMGVGTSSTDFLSDHASRLVLGGATSQSINKVYFFFCENSYNPNKIELILKTIYAAEANAVLVSGIGSKKQARPVDIARNRKALGGTMFSKKLFALIKSPTIQYSPKDCTKLMDTIADMANMIVRLMTVESIIVMLAMHIAFIVFVFDIICLY